MMTEEQLDKYSERCENIHRSLGAIRGITVDIAQNANTISALVAEIRILKNTLAHKEGTQCITEEEAAKYQHALLLIENAVYPVITLSDDSEVVSIEIVRTMKAIAKNALADNLEK